MEAPRRDGSGDLNATLMGWLNSLHRAGGGCCFRVRTVIDQCSHIYRGCCVNNKPLSLSPSVFNKSSSPFCCTGRARWGWRRRDEPVQFPRSAPIDENYVCDCAFVSSRDFPYLLSWEWHALGTHPRAPTRRCICWRSSPLNAHRQPATYFKLCLLFPGALNLQWQRKYCGKCDAQQPSARTHAIKQVQ